MKKELKHLQAFEQTTDKNLNISDVISSKTKTEILKLIEDCGKQGHFYIFNNREDFVETRTDWSELADTAETLYYLIEDIKGLLNKG